MASTEEKLYLRVTPADQAVAQTAAPAARRSQRRALGRLLGAWPALLRGPRHRSTSLVPAGPQTLRITPRALVVATPVESVEVAWDTPCVFLETDLHYVLEFHADGPDQVHGPAMLHRPAPTRTVVIPKTPNARAARSFANNVRRRLLLVVEA